ncbi:hypothetical protein GO491_11765 [Flavobacteriaceae bacterium Ap0902]|nr:hypothetical protein [Flavobacteriaceae bacterium Ap0902]
MMGETKTTPEKARAKAVITAKDVYLSIAAKSAENRKDGKPNETISLTKKFNVEFTKDFGNFKKGTTLNGISELAFKMYNANGAVKEI